MRTPVAAAMGSSHLRFPGRMAFRGACSMPRNSGPAWLNTWCVVADALHPLATDCASPEGTPKHNKSTITGPIGRRNRRELLAPEDKRSFTTFAWMRSPKNLARSEQESNRVVYPDCADNRAVDRIWNFESSRMQPC